MKKNLIHGALILFATIALVGCGKSNTDKETEEVLPSISVSADGLFVKMSGSDLDRTFVITSDIEAPNDILVTVTTDAASTDAELLTPTIVIKEGTTTANGKIKFLAEAFPLGAEAKNIKVSIASETVIVDPAKREIVYSVKGADQPIETYKAILSCEVTEVVVVGIDVRIPAKITMEAPAEQYTEFTVLWGPENTITSGVVTSMAPVFIEEGEQEANFEIVFKASAIGPGVEGVTHLMITSQGAITDENNTIKISVRGVAPNVATLSANGLDVVVGDADVEKTITITLTDNVSADVEFNVTVEGKEGDYKLVNKTITIRKGTKTGTGVIRFLKEAFPIELMTSTATISVTTANTGFVVGNPTRLTFNIRGTGTAPIGTISIEGSSTVKVGASDLTVEFTVALSEVLSKSATFAIAATSDKAGSFILNKQSVTINQGSLAAKGSITFRAASFRYDTDKATTTVTIASKDVIVINSGSKIDFKVSGDALNPNKEDVKYCFEETAKTIYVGAAGVDVDLFFISEGRLMGNEISNSIYPEITGATEGVDYIYTVPPPITVRPTSAPANGYIYLKILPAADGKIMTVELFCDEATIGAQKSLDLKVVYVDWMPSVRSAPKVELSTDDGSYAIAVSAIKVNDAVYTTTYPRKEWVDMYNTQSFNVHQGANTIEITSYSHREQYYLSYSTMLVYADFNNDGDFNDAGEEITAKKIEGLAIGATNAKQFTATMNVPAGAATEFPIRVGAAVITSKNISDVFNSGYFVNPNNSGQLRMTDFKAVVQ